MLRFFGLLLLLALVCRADLDTDGDGLSDFHERHKYRTDPARADTDGDGVPDGDWLERREYTYWVRSVVWVMRPVTPEFLTDDYQDARVLDEGPQHVELEVVHYPLNTVADAIEANPRWRERREDMAPWLAPGPTSDVSAALREALYTALGQDGIPIDELDDRSAVERVSAWLIERAPDSGRGFTAYVTAFDRGRPTVPEELQSAGPPPEGRTWEQQWAHELSAAGMFRDRTRGSCTSTAIYLSGCLRALGIPARTILCNPIIDASDPREVELLGQLAHHGIRSLLQTALPRSQSWTSHTFNEVWVGGRWHRLNAAKLGQNILDAQCLGLQTHVATFRDWADARMWETVGRRQVLRVRDDLFGHANPYSTISLRDGFGVHAALDNPPAPDLIGEIARFAWADDPALPEDIRQRLRGRLGVLAVARAHHRGAMARLLQASDRTLVFEAEGAPPIRSALDAGCWWMKRDECFIWVPLPGVTPGTTYRVQASNECEGFRWQLDADQIAREP